MLEAASLTEPKATYEPQVEWPLLVPLTSYLTVTTRFGIMYGTRVNSGRRNGRQGEPG